MLGTKSSSQGFFHLSTKSNLFSFISFPSASLGSPHPKPQPERTWAAAQEGRQPPATPGNPCSQAHQDQGVATAAQLMAGP